MAGYDPLPPLANLRDLGGGPVRGTGRIRTGLAFRSTDLSSLDPASAAAIATLGLRTVFDLRTAFERESHPDRVPDGAAYVALDVLADGSATTSPSELMALLNDPRSASALLGGGGSMRIFVAKYREFVDLDSARRAYGRLLADLARPENRPALFHCTTGKDRTGWAAAVLQLLLGVPEDAVMDDYLRSNDDLLAAFAAPLEAFRARGGDPDVLLPMIGVRAEYLEASLDAVRARFGSLEAYVRDGLGVDAATVAALLDAFVDRECSPQ